MHSIPPAWFRFVLVVAMLTGCTDPPGEEPDGGDGGVIFCTANADCPTAEPLCQGGICTRDDCDSDADCPSGGVCNSLTKQCEDAPPCTSDADCASGWVCNAFSGLCEEAGASCTTVDDCDVNEICRANVCVPFDDDEPCVTDADCPRDHQCNSLGDARCQGCLTDAFCQSSPYGPKCDRTDDGNGPGLGYCYEECDASGSKDCPPDFICDLDRGGLCVPACQSNADCNGGLVCFQLKCQGCTTNTQCLPGQICTGGVCVAEPSCDDAGCQANLGLAYYCDTTTNSCKLGCSPSGCTGDISDCNRCPSPQTCNTTTHQCTGGFGCTACPTDCSLTGWICDTVICECVDPITGGCSVQLGGACTSTGECCNNLDCIGAVPGLIQGRCGQVCDSSTFCVCDNGNFCEVLTGDILDVFLCLLGASGGCF